MKERKISPFYKIVKRLLRMFYPKIETMDAENIPEEPAIIVGNHCQLHGPIICELYSPCERYTWCAEEMMHIKEVPGYAFQDFWSQKPKRSQWYYKIASYAIAPLSVLIFNNANTIPVYRDFRALSTFRESLKRLNEGSKVVIFPEQDIKYNNIVNDFQVGFVEIARMYYRKTGVEISFVPMYIAPRLKKVYYGKPIRYCHDNSMDMEKRRICDYLMREITDMACDLPRHTVVPYRNMPKKNYPKNIP